MKLSELQSKKIIDVTNGSNIGTILDIRITDDGRIDALIIEQGRNILSLGRDNNSIILWKNIIKIGEDVILVERNNS